ncbi:MAG: SAM-dependent chlorinase/fluorinase [Flavobacteriales bacterium]|nr:SAM-dependent chlorinase/fluorinase [Flavobacteriales bacterium]
MAIITLLTDFGNHDWHIAALRGTIERVMPGTLVVDIAHGLDFGQSQHAALLLRFAWPHFPPNTIHFVSIDASPHSHLPFVAFKYGGQYFMGRDDGLFSMMLNGEQPEILSNISDLLSPNNFPVFAARDLYVKVAALILSGTPLQSIGKPHPGLQPKFIVAPTYTQDQIVGSVIYTDHWGNAITNIHRELYNRISLDRQPEIVLKRPAHTIRRISRSYSEVNDGELVALFNSVQHLEIAICRGSARQYCGLEVGDQVRIFFQPK